MDDDGFMIYQKSVKRLSQGLERAEGERPLTRRNVLLTWMIHSLMNFILSVWKKSRRHSLRQSQWIWGVWWNQTPQKRLSQGFKRGKASVPWPDVWMSVGCRSEPAGRLAHYYSWCRGIRCEFAVVERFWALSKGLSKHRKLGKHAKACDMNSSLRICTLIVTM